MIIICPYCEKKFTLDENLIPKEGRLLKCGSCDETWFFKKNNETVIKSPDLTSKQHKNIKIKKKEILNNQISKKIINTKSKKNINEQNTNKGSEIIKYQAKSNFTFVKLLSYTVVLIISFVALIVFVDTFKSPLYSYFPDLEFLLFNLYETIEDIRLFMNDLV